MISRSARRANHSVLAIIETSQGGLVFLDRIHKAGGARLVRQPNQLHGSVYDGRRGNAIQVQELVTAQRLSLRT